MRARRTWSTTSANRVSGPTRHASRRYRLSVGADRPGKVRDCAPVGHRREQDLRRCRGHSGEAASPQAASTHLARVGHYARASASGRRRRTGGCERGLNETRDPCISGGEREGPGGPGGVAATSPELAAPNGLGVVAGDQLGPPLGVVGVLEGLDVGRRCSPSRWSLAGEERQREADLMQRLEDVRRSAARARQDKQVAVPSRLGPAAHPPCRAARRPRRGQICGGLRAQQIERCRRRPPAA